MYKRGYDCDYQYDWVLKKAGQKIDEQDYADAKQSMAQVQGKDEPVNKLGNS